MFPNHIANFLLKDGKKNWPVIAAGFALILSPLVLTAIFTYSSMRRDLTALIYSQRGDVAYLAATTLKDKLDRLVDITVSLASRVRFRRLVSEGNWEEAVQILSGVPGEFPMIDRLFLTDLDGTLMADTPALPDVRGRNFAARDWYRGISRRWTPYVSEVYQRTAVPRLNVVAAAAPIKVESGQVVGILVAQIRLDSLLEWTKHIDVGDNGFVFLVDNGGKIAAHPTLDLQAKIVDFSKVPAVQKLLRGAKGVGILADPLGTERQLFAYHPVAAHGWGVVVQQPADVAFALRDSSLQRVFSTYGLILLLNCALAYLILHTLIRSKRAEASHARLAAIVESSEHAIVSKSLDGVITSWNKGAEKLYGYSAMEVVGHPMSLLESPDRPGETATILEKIRRGEAVEYYETTRVKKDGTRIEVSLTVSPVQDASGRITGASLIGRDISRRKKLEQELREKNRELEQQNHLVHEASRLKSEFLANMSHELRTPLNAIIGFAQLMHDGKVGAVSPAHKEYLGDILTSGRHLLELINDILDLSKVEAGRLEFHPEPVDLNVIVAEVRQILHMLAAQKRLGMETEISPVVEKVVVDPAKLKQVLYNYLSNAIKFTPDNGRIKIRVLAEDSAHFRLEIEDNGTGIRSEDIGKLFTEFEQLDGGTAKKYPGTGLGLALTKRIVEAQGGRVGVQSVYGRGSIFFAVLPTIAEQKTVSPAEIRPVDAPAIDLPRVLIIEDNERDLSSLARVLSQAGYLSEAARTGAEALAKTRATNYSAILLDLILPDMIGWDVLHSIRTHGLNQDAPVIVVTVVSEKGLAKGFPIQDYLTKPVSPESLLNSLRSARMRGNGTRPKVLIVDDDPNALKIAKAAFQSIGYEPVCHSNGNSGLAAASESKFAAVILDLLMPGMNGFEFLVRFREIAVCRNTPVIIWTNRDITFAERERLEHLAQSIALKSSDGIEGVLREFTQTEEKTGRSAAGHIGDR